MAVSRVALRLALFFSILCAGCESPLFIRDVNAQMPKTTGFLEQKIAVNDHVRRYTIFVPEHYTPYRYWPVIVSLHGFGGRGDDGVSQVGTGLGRYLSEHCHDFPFIVVFPQARVDWANESSQDDAIAILDKVQHQYSIDQNHVTLTGCSLGGAGAFLIAARYPDRFSSVVTMSALAEEHVARRLTNLPVWCFHFDTDPIVGSVNSEIMVQRINAAGGHAHLTKIPGFGHYVWDQAYTARLFDWMLAQSRPPTQSASTR